MDSDCYKEIQAMINKGLKRKAVDSMVARSGQIVAIKGGKYYDLQTADRNSTYSDIGCATPEFDWQMGQWVTFEWTGTDYQITGTSTTQAG